LSIDFIADGPRRVPQGNGLTQAFLARSQPLGCPTMSELSNRSQSLYDKVTQLREHL